MVKSGRFSNQELRAPRSRPDRPKHAGPLLAVLLAMTMEGGYAGPRPSGSLVPTRSEVIATHGMAATSHPLATQIALDVLKRGGTAVDAAIAANAVMGLIEPTGSGVGGDLFAIVWDAKTKKLHGLNASGRSPKSLTLEKLRGARQLDSKTIPPRGPLPVSVPGCVDGWFELHGKFGKLPMKELLEPAIRYARNGSPVTEAHRRGLGAERAAARASARTSAETFMPDGRAPAKGEVFRNPRLANTLSAIAEGGRDAFYKGDIAAAHRGVHARQRRLPDGRRSCRASTRVGRAGLDELPRLRRLGAAAERAGHRRAPDAQRARGVRPRSDGASQRRTYLHLMIEAKKLAFEDRARYYADPAFAKMPVRGLISKDYAAEAREARSTERRPTDARRRSRCSTRATRST